VKLKRAAYRHIEAEIYAYEDTLATMKQLRLEIMYESRHEEKIKVSGGGPAGSIVERRATRLADSVLLREMERITGAIREVYARAKDEGRRVVWVKYGLAIDWQPPAEIRARMRNVNRCDLNTQDMAQILAVDESTFHRYRTGFIYGVAERLGWY